LKEIKLKGITGKKIADERYTQKQTEKKRRNGLVLNFTRLK